MATAIMTEPVMIKTAMKKMGMEERACDLLDIIDEMRLDAMLKVSEEQEKRGEVRDAREALKEIRAKVLYGKES